GSWELYRVEMTPGGARWPLRQALVIANSYSESQAFSLSGTHADGEKVRAALEASGYSTIYAPDTEYSDFFS
ncbi:MAG TPA: hypothetical protein DF282_10575, partial [Hyphomonas sp.]|nr:hypothetical protein [Hyphomonas sp.]